VRSRDGLVVTGKVVQHDEFTISLLDNDGWTRSWPAAAVTITGDDPLKAHVDQLGKYTDADMHDVYAFLATLK
jgi:cytochrome c oxidase cbb3-type subunit 3